MGRRCTNGSVARGAQAQQELESLESGRGGAGSEDDVQKEEEKYRKLQERDQEMTTFIADFPRTLETEQDAVRTPASSPD